MRVGIVTLGCDKNTVDSERYLALLAGHAAEQTSDLADADIVIVNTCGFVDAAKKESIDALIEAGKLKEQGHCRTVVAIGCMVERHKAELQSAIPEIDIFLGASEADRLVPALMERGALDPSMIALHPGTRIYAGSHPHVRYLKVSEGCDHGCAFCAIPLMRGRHRSFALRDVIAEAQLLELQGAREINLVAQDLAHYGRDTRDGNGLPELLRALVEETGVPWIRLLYLYSAGITDHLLETVAREPRILNYLDMPMQHASDEVLARMRRPERKATLRGKVRRFREAVPDLAIRTTCIVGFPGETEQQFEELLAFLEEIRFDRVGAFTYSAQEGTRAAGFADDVPETLKRERLERLTELQRVITAETYEARIGTAAQAIVDSPLEEPGGGSSGRLWWQADDIDGVTIIDETLSPGTIAEVAVQEVTDDYDFSASLIRVLEHTSTGREMRTSRSLPLASSTAGSFGR